MLNLRNKNSVVQNYNKGFSGFAARLSEEEAKSIAQRPGVVSVFPDPVLQLHTTRSWDFLKYQTAVKIDSTPTSPFDSSSAGADTIIGILDTGIWPEAESFIDDDMNPIPSHWKGKCMEGQNFTSSNCNRNCIPGSLDDSKVKGKIVLCENKDEDYGSKYKYDTLKSQGAVGMILVDNDERQVPSKYGTFPIAAVTEADGAQILSYIKSNSNPMATILPTVMIPNYKPAPVVGYFSSRGPTFGIKNLLKPDIAAPGVAILAAWPSNDKREALPEKEPPVFDILSGTSMACPHVSGLAAMVKSQHPTWSPSATRSAIMTTAIQMNNLHAPITTNTGSRATAYDIGAGEISLSGPLQPGLVYETETIDYIQFLCNIGYDTSKIKSIAPDVPNNFSCSSNSNSDAISNMNYPSIAISNLKDNESKTVNRTVTNVGEEDLTYTAVVEAPASMHVEVVPNKLQFTKNVKKLSFQVTFTLSTSSVEDLFGSITWSNEKYKVRSPFVVSA
ncbi:UNVERIFIED_CONTAM: CO(2)-response secreted protease [Sesamum indicum]